MSESGANIIKGDFRSAKSAKLWVKRNCIWETQAGCDQGVGGHYIIVEQEDYDNLKIKGRG